MGVIVSGSKVSDKFIETPMWPRGGKGNFKKFKLGRPQNLMGAKNPSSNPKQLESSKPL